MIVAGELTVRHPAETKRQKVDRSNASLGRTTGVTAQVSTSLAYQVAATMAKPWAPLRQNVAMEPRANAKAHILTNVAGGMPSDMSAICGKLGQLLQSLKLEG